MSKDKSILDDVPVKDEAFPLHKGLPLSIVGVCPSCGAPIYGRPQVLTGDDPIIKYTCLCWKRTKTIEQTMETK